MATAIRLRRPAPWKPPSTRDLGRWQGHTTDNIARLQDAVNLALTGQTITNIYDINETTTVGLSLGYRLITEIDFGSTDTDYKEFSVASLPWITASAILHFQVTGGTTDHPDFEDAMLEEISCRVTSITPASGFSAIATAPSGTWGTYKVHIIAVI